MKKLKTAVLVLIVFIVGIQFVRPPLNQNSEAHNQNIIALYNPSAAVTAILQHSCYDCHSDNTRYPWYQKVQPFGWLLNHHIQDGKEELNFDDFGNYSRLKQKSKLRSMKEQIQDNVMPLKSYKMMHKEARLTRDQKKILTDWIDQRIDSLGN